MFRNTRRASESTQVKGFAAQLTNPALPECLLAWIWCCVELAILCVVLVIHSPDLTKNFYSSAPIGSTDSPLSPSATELKLMVMFIARNTLQKNTYCQRNTNVCVSLRKRTKTYGISLLLINFPTWRKSSV